jgi:hypothetical protein
MQIINIPIDLIDSVLFVNIGNKKFNSNGQEYKTIAPPANIKLPYVLFVFHIVLIVLSCNALLFIQS